MNSYYFLIIIKQLINKNIITFKKLFSREFQNITKVFRYLKKSTNKIKNSTIK